MYVYVVLLCLVATCSGQFSDQLQIFELNECVGEDKFPCTSGRCIPQSQYCDGRIDCDDGTDENYCPYHKADAKFCNQTHQFLCQDRGRCIAHRLMCDGNRDCQDGSDEANCTDDFVIADSAICNGYQCNDGTCISRLWVCDGRYDCPDRSDEYREDVCPSSAVLAKETALGLLSHSLLDHSIIDGSFCKEAPLDGERSYKCLDGTYCLPPRMMCDGMKDCRDGSDEGDFCKNWHTMCSTYNCGSNDTKCFPDRNGPSCYCVPFGTLNQYNNVTRRCEDLNECLLERPQCSHRCVNANRHFRCLCDEGYVKDEFEYLCFAQGPEAKLFFSTRNEIKFLEIKSKKLVTVATGIKEAHGVSYDGQYLYWVETAQGHQSIVRAHLEDVKETKQVLAAFGLEDPGDISVDWLGRNLYFSDAVKGTISACSLDGSHCSTIPTKAKHPKFVTVDPRNGKMYWADYNKRPVIMTARMDGANAEMAVAEGLDTFVTGLALDMPNDRLYFVDKTIKVLMISGKVYSLFEEPFHRPYSIAVFENTVFWSDWTSTTIQTADKLHGTLQKRNILLNMDTAVFGMHMYHPALMPATTNPCAHHHCSHLCFVTSNATFVCGCPDGMHLTDNICSHTDGYRPHYIVVAEGSLFTRLDYNSVGNPEAHATNFDIGRVQAMAYDSNRDTLYIYDGQRRYISFINMTEFTLGVTHRFIYQGLDNVVDMDYNFASDSLYILDAGRRQIEVVSLRTQKRAIVYTFFESEVPLSFCVMPDYGSMLVALAASERHNIRIESVSLDGSQRHTIALNNFKGPHIRLRYAHIMDNVFISDEGHAVIDIMHPGGSGRDNFRELSTTVTSLALTDSYAFWTDRRTPRLFWSGIHEINHQVRRIELSMFPNNTQLLIQSTIAGPRRTNPLLKHPCVANNPCTDVCVQAQPSSHRNLLTYKCLCPAGYFMSAEKCIRVAVCRDHEFQCRKSNMCVDSHKVCNGVSDCVYNEDELVCKVITQPTTKEVAVCQENEFQCNGTTICLPRLLVCDSRPDCPDGSDEQQDECDIMQCFDTEFKCASRRSCIPKTWTCDGDDDCGDGTDELECESTLCKPEYYQCRNRECIEVKKRCDGIQDCFDYSDEEDCDEQLLVQVPEAELPKCAEYEFACELNKSICLPLTAQCNMKVDCPGGTDENNCEFRCSPHGLFSCKQQLNCIGMKRVCNGHKDCVDGSDETPEACYSVNRTSHIYAPVLYPKEECLGYLCNNGQCIEHSQVCDSKQDCADNSDEGGHCSAACIFNACAHTCSRTPRGPQCECLPGYKLAADGRLCQDIDECKEEPCSQQCVNTPGSFLCSCHYGYALRSDRRSCKATRGNMAVLYLSGNTVRSVTTDGHSMVEFSDKTIASVTDVDFNVRTEKLYLTSPNLGKLIEVNSTLNVVAVTNVGRPTRVAVEWVTGNSYFVDTTSGDSCIRVCNVRRKRCAKLQKLPTNAVVTAFIVDPKAGLMFYCVTSGSESVVWSASLSGNSVRDLTTVRNCTGLAVDSFMRQLYVAETGPPHIIRMDYKGDQQMILADHPQLQSPHGLAIFEDHIYYLVANTFRLSRCRLFGPKHCEPFIYQVFDANTFVVRHESVQRDDVKNICEGYTCSNVCVLDVDGPKCICEDGMFSKGGSCSLLEKETLPLFNGWSYQDYRHAHRASFIIIIIVLVLLAVYIGLFVYYHFVYKPRKIRTSPYTEVRYQNTTTGSHLSYVPTLDMASDGGISHEFVNPLQYVRNLVQQTVRKAQKPIGTAGLNLNLSRSPQSQHGNFSDTESDHDDRENLIPIRRN